MYKFEYIDIEQTHGYPTKIITEYDKLDCHISEPVQAFRSFLLAVGFNQESINRYINDPEDVPKYGNINI